MSYTFEVDQLYRMPTHFGPSLGPRQGLNGRRYSCVDGPKDLSINARFKAEPTEVQKLLPPNFTLREPHVVDISFGYSKEIEWLAGRGYNTFGVSCPVTYKGQRDVVNGELLLVLWENMADPIITGREELGFSKVYCELPEPQFIDDKVICRASWDGCQFASLQLSGLKEVPPQDLPEGPPSEGTLHYKYIPKTSAPGEADAAYAVLTPAEYPNGKLDQVMLAESATINFRESSWEELPTLVHIVNTLSELTLGDCLGATLMKTRGGKDFSDQRILD